MMKHKNIPNVSRQKVLAHDLRSGLDSLVNKRCWGIAAGEGTGSHVTIDFGNKIPRSRPLKNPHLSEDLRKYKGEMGLFVECAWRLDASDKVVCGCLDSNKNDGPMVTGLKQLVGKRVKRVELNPPAYDVKVYFENSLTLTIFCDQTDCDEENDNYSVLLPDKILIVGTRGKLSYEPRTL